MAMYSGIDRPTSGGRGRRPRDPIAAALGSSGRRLRDLWQIPPPPRGGSAFSKRTYSPGQKEYVISARRRACERLNRVFNNTH